MKKLALFIVISLISCNKQNQDNYIIDKNKIFNLPNSLHKYCSPDSSYLATDLEIYDSSDFKIIALINVACATCVNDFEKWNELEEEINSEFDLNIFYILHSSDDFRFFTYIAKSGKINLTSNQYYLDIKDQLKKMNAALLETTYNQTFLLSSKNEVLLSLNPHLNTEDKNTLFEFIHKNYN